MDPKTGQIFHDIKKAREEFIPLTEKEYRQLKPMTKPARKGYMRNKPCPCGSGKKFKRCHWDDPKALWEE